MKKLNNKGFTLIEIVIVIVIIAILAAMLVPSLTSWIDNSKQKSFVEGANSVKTACLSQLSSNYATYDEFKFKDNDKGEVENLAGDGVKIDQLITTGNLTTPTEAKHFAVKVELATNSVSKITVVGKDFTATFTNSTNAWEVSKNQKAS